MDSPARAEVYEQQADACLLAGEQHRQRLLQVATRLTGCPEEGMDLFQQTLLNCHDAIQRRGFTGQGYAGYLLTSLRNLHVQQQQRARLRTVRVDFQAQQPQADADSEVSPPRGQGPAELASAAPGTEAERARLARQVQRAARKHLPMQARVMLRLHADGESCQDITDLMGLPGHRRAVYRQLERIKESLRHTFHRAWLALLD